MSSRHGLQKLDVDPTQYRSHYESVSSIVDIRIPKSLYVIIDVLVSCQGYELCTDLVFSILDKKANIRHHIFAEILTKEMVFV